MTALMWMLDLFVIWGGGFMEISDLSPKMVLSWHWSQVRVLRLSLFFWSFSLLGTGVFTGGGVVSFLVGNIDVGVFFLKWDETKGELCLPQMGRALMVLCFP
jgi:hypothetical protein